jgi:hypothetical protein
MIFPGIFRVMLAGLPKSYQHSTPFQCFFYYIFLIGLMWCHISPSWMVGRTLVGLQELLGFFFFLSYVNIVF